MNAAKTRVQFVLHFGPQPGATNFHMYFAPYAEWYEKVDRHETGDGPLQHPAALAVPLGTMLSFTWIKTRSHDDQGMGSSNRLPIDQIQRVIYTTRAGRAGLLLPKWTKTLQYEGCEPLISEGSENFFPFSGEPHETKVTGGRGTIIALPASADTTIPA